MCIIYYFANFLVKYETSFLREIVKRKKKHCRFLLFALSLEVTRKHDIWPRSLQVPSEYNVINNNNIVSIECHEGILIIHNILITLIITYICTITIL